MLSKQTTEIAPTAIAGPTALTASQLQSVVFHELGHSFGLDHYSDLYQGQIQVMSIGAGSLDVTNYQAGDINGLKSQHYIDTL